MTAIAVIVVSDEQCDCLLNPYYRENNRILLKGIGWVAFRLRPFLICGSNLSFSEVVRKEEEEKGYSNQ